MNKTEYIISEFLKNGISLPQEKAEKLLKMSELLVSYNEKVNLTAITDFEQIVIKHFADSILPFADRSVEVPTGAAFIDVGTGAGFPSIPLLIWREDLKGTLLESMNKRCVFLKEVCDALGLDAVIVNARAEDYAKEKRESFDIATARAVAALPILSEYCLPFVKKGGSFIALKSVNESADEAQTAITLLGGSVERVTDNKLSNGDDRRVFYIKKISHTPTKYPRNPAQIKKKPL